MVAYRGVSLPMIDEKQYHPSELQMSCAITCARVMPVIHTQVRTLIETPWIADRTRYAGRHQPSSYTEEL